MKRYKFIYQMIEDKKGEWCKNTDVERLEEDFEELKEINREMHLNFKIYRDEIKNLTKGTTVLTNRIITLEKENKTLTALFDLQHTRTVEIEKLWQAETGKKGTLPDLGVLIEWLESRYNKIVKLYLEEAQRNFDLEKAIDGVIKCGFTPDGESVKTNTKLWLITLSKEE